MQSWATIISDISSELKRLQVFCDKIVPKFIMSEINLYDLIVKQKILYLIWKSMDLNQVYLHKVSRQHNALQIFDNHLLV
jgi:hypothetical protein